MNKQRRNIAIDIDLAPGVYLPDAQAVRLLADVEKTGSINRSAKELGLSYATAWRCLKEAETGLRMPLLAPRKGGAGGGGTRLTPQGSSFVGAYTDMLNEAEQLVSECFRRHFPEL